MLGLPASTEIKKLITKKKVYEHFAHMRIEQKFWNISETCQSTSRCL